MSKLYTVTIASGASLSDAVDLEGRYVVEIVMPSAWTPGPLTFQLGDEEGALQDLYSAFHGGEYTVASVVAGAGRRIKLDPAELLGDGWLKVRSGTSGTPVNQAAERQITLKTRRVI